MLHAYFVAWEHSCSVVECLTRDQRAPGSSLTGVTVLCPSARHIYPCLVLVQPKKTCPSMTKIVDWDIKNQTKQTQHTLWPASSVVRAHIQRGVLCLIIGFWQIKCHT